MPEVTQEQIDRLQNGEEVAVEIEVWHGYDDPSPMTEVIILTKADGGDE